MTTSVASVPGPMLRKRCYADRNEGSGRPHYQHVSGSDSAVAHRLQHCRDAADAYRCKHRPHHIIFRLTGRPHHHGRYQHDGGQVQGGKLNAETGGHRPRGRLVGLIAKA